MWSSIIVPFTQSIGAPFPALDAAADKLLGNARTSIDERIANPIDDHFGNELNEFHVL